MAWCGFQEFKSDKETNTWVSFQVSISNILSNFRIERNAAAFLFMILIYFMDHSYDTDNQLRLFVLASSNHQVLITVSRVPAAQRRSGHQTAQPRMLSALMPAACPATAAAARGQGGSRAIGHSAEPATRLGLPSALSRLICWRVEHHRNSSGRCNNLMYGSLCKLTATIARSSGTICSRRQP